MCCVCMYVCMRECGLLYFHLITIMLSFIHVAITLFAIELHVIWNIRASAPEKIQRHQPINPPTPFSRYVYLYVCFGAENERWSKWMSKRMKNEMRYAMCVTSIQPMHIHTRWNSNDNDCVMMLMVATFYSSNNIQPKPTHSSTRNIQNSRLRLFQLRTNENKKKCLIFCVCIFRCDLSDDIFLECLFVALLQKMSKKMYFVISYLVVLNQYRTLP